MSASIDQRQVWRPEAHNASAAHDGINCCKLCLNRRIRLRLDEQYRLIEFADLGDERGNLVVIEGEGMDIPFDIKRVFYIYGSDSTVVRGQHANRETEFLLVNVSGNSRVRVDNGEESAVIGLNRPRMGLYLSSMLWKDMYDFSDDSVLLVLASRHYDEKEYIRDYDTYLQALRENKGH